MMNLLDEIVHAPIKMLGYTECLLTGKNVYGRVLSGRRMKDCSTPDDYSFKNYLCKSNPRRMYMD